MLSAASGGRLRTGGSFLGGKVKTGGSLIEGAIGGGIGDFDVNKLSDSQMYHDLHFMSPWEFSAMKEGLHQSIGGQASPAWFPMDLTSPVADPSHYKSILGMQHSSEAAEALQRGGSGLKDTMKHGFHTLVKNGRKIVDHGKKFAGAARQGIDLAKHIPLIGKYAEKGDELLKKAEFALEQAERGLKAAEGIDVAIAGPQLGPARPPPAGPPVETPRQRERRFRRERQANARALTKVLATVPDRPVSAAPLNPVIQKPTPEFTDPEEITPEVAQRLGLPGGGTGFGSGFGSLKMVGGSLHGVTRLTRVAG